MNMAIGAAAPSTAVANLLGSLAVLLSILFGGFLLSSKQMPAVVSWMAQLSFVRSVMQSSIGSADQASPSELALIGQSAILSAM